MKLLRLTGLITGLIFLLIQCNNSKSVADGSKDSTAKSDTLKVIASIERTACYGRCPVYKAEIFKDASVTYTGRMNVEKLGEFKSKISPVQLDVLTKKAQEIGYMSLKESYDGNITDLPACITYISIGGNSKRIYNRYQGPKQLKEYEKVFDQILDELKWEKTKDLEGETQDYSD